MPAVRSFILLLRVLERRVVGRLALYARGPVRCCSLEPMHCSRAQSSEELGGVAKQRRPRWTPSEEAKAILEAVFAADSFPTFAVRNQLAEQLKIDSRQVQIWCQDLLTQPTDSTAARRSEHQLLPRQRGRGARRRWPPCACPRPVDPRQTARRAPGAGRMIRSRPSARTPTSTLPAGAV